MHWKSIVPALIAATALTVLGLDAASAATIPAPAAGRLTPRLAADQPGVCGSATAAPGGAASVTQSSAAVDDGNSLIVNVTAETKGAAQVYVEYGNGEAGMFRSVTAATTGNSTRIQVGHLRATSTYCYRVVAIDDKGRTTPGATGQFTTRALPAGLDASNFSRVAGKFSAPVILLDQDEKDFNGIVAIDSDSFVVWYYQSPPTEAGHVQAIAQAPNFDVIFMSLTVGVREVSPAGAVVNKLDSACTLWHHEILLKPDGKVLFLGNALHAPGDVLPGHGQQISDTIEEWDPKSGKVTRLFDLWDFVSPTERFSLDSDKVPPPGPPSCPKQPGTEDWTHSNSLAFGDHGNVLLSVRHLDQVISIAPDYKSIEWKLGGASSTFTFASANDRFYHQHTARMLPNGHIIVFDNGFRRPEEEGGFYSRGLELALDYNKKTATKAWEYRHAPTLKAGCCGSVARLPNGNTIIDFGDDTSNGGFKVVEADPTGKLVAEALISSDGKRTQYRANPVESILGETQIQPSAPVAAASEESGGGFSTMGYVGIGAVWVALILIAVIAIVIRRRVGRRASD